MQESQKNDNRNSEVNISKKDICTQKAAVVIWHVCRPIMGAQSV